MLKCELIYFNGCEQAEYIRKGCQREFPVCQAMRGGIASWDAEVFQGRMPGCEEFELR
ncbi:MAG: hypothetical protein ACI3U2_11250 [Anaerovibrio sp.]